MRGVVSDLGLNLADLEAAKHQYSTYLDKPEPTLFEARRNRSVSLFILKP